VFPPVSLLEFIGRNSEASKDEPGHDDATVNSGTAAVKTALLINGGAAAAVLAFIGGLANDGRVAATDIHIIADGLVWFGIGVLGAAVSMGLAYFANRAILETVYNNSRLWKITSAGFQVATVLAVVGSLVVFVLGLWEIRAAIGKLHCRSTKSTIVPTNPSNAAPSSF
jgi:hypothetical protein